MAFFPHSIHSQENKADMGFSLLKKTHHRQAKYMFASRLWNLIPQSASHPPGLEPKAKTNHCALGLECHVWWSGGPRLLTGSPARRCYACSLSPLRYHQPSDHNKTGRACAPHAEGRTGTCSPHCGALRLVVDRRRCLLLFC